MFYFSSTHNLRSMPGLRLSALMAATAISLAPQNAALAQQAVELPTITVEGAGEGDANSASEGSSGSGEVRSTQNAAWGPVEGYVARDSAAGSKTDTPILLTPRSVDVITRDQMDDRGVQNMVEAVRYTAGVTTGAFGYDPRFDQIYIRGFPVNIQGGDFRDGLLQGGGSFAYFRTETYGLERVDIIKGPAAALYGQTTPGGLINRISKMPLETFRADLDLQLGNDNRYQAAFDVSGPAAGNDNLFYRLVGLAREAEGQLPGTPNNALYLAPSFTFKNDKTTFTVLASIQESQLPSSAIYAQTGTGGVLAGEPATPSNFNLLDQRQAQVGYMLEHEFSDIWKVRQNLRYGYIDLDTHYISGYRTPYSSAVNYTETLNTFGVDNQSQWTFATGPLAHKVLAGVDYRIVDFEYGMTTGPAPSYSPFIPDPFVIKPGIPASAYTDNSLEQTGIYLQDQIKFGDGWNLSIGGRNDWAQTSQKNSLTGIETSNRDDSAFTWQTGLLYAFEQGFSPYVSYATSFQPSTNVDQEGNLLEPSYGEQYEAGLKFQPKGSRSFFTAAIYQITRTNYAVPVPVYFYYLPVGDVRMRGLELEALGEIYPGLDIIGAYTYSDPVVTSAAEAGVVGKAPVVTPEHVASLWAKYTAQDGPLKGFGIGAGVRYVGETYGDAANTYVNPAQTYVDAAVSYETGPWKFALNGTNLAGKEYLINNEGYYYVSEGRTLLANVRYRW